MQSVWDNKHHQINRPNNVFLSLSLPSLVLLLSVPSFSFMQPPSLNFLSLSLSHNNLSLSPTLSSPFSHPPPPQPVSLSLTNTHSVFSSHAHTKDLSTHSTVLNLLHIIIAHVLIDGDDVILLLLSLIGDVILTALLVLCPLLHLPVC